MRIRLGSLTLIWMIKAYKLLISPFIGQNCRFHPGCANYAIQAVEVHGVFKGSYLATRRILRCHPLHPGGYDPVPGCEQSCSTNTAEPVGGSMVPKH